MDNGTPSTPTMLDPLRVWTQFSQFLPQQQQQTSPSSLILPPTAAPSSPQNATQQQASRQSIQELAVQIAYLISQQQRCDVVDSGSGAPSSGGVGASKTAVELYAAATMAAMAAMSPPAAASAGELVTGGCGARGDYPVAPTLPPPPPQQPVGSTATGTTTLTGINKHWRADARFLEDVSYV